MSAELSTTLIKATRIREYVAKHPGCVLKGIAKDLRLNKTTAYRILTTLVQLKWLTKQGSCYYVTDAATGAAVSTGGLAS